jgi:AraC-like DNA-binding protein/quercetin dioxygenase-like cupin family protein
MRHSTKESPPALARRSPGIVYEDAYSIIEPQINSEGAHVFPFDPTFPVQVRFLSFGKNREIRLNRHDYFELLYVHSGEVIYQVQDRRMRLSEGELFLMGSTLWHGMTDYPKGKVKAAVLYFLPDLIRGRDNTSEDVQYLMPFLVQESGFAHVVPASTGIPAQIFDLMKRTAAELPANTSRSRLSVKTYLKMMLVLLVNQFAGYRGGEDTQLRREQELERLRPLFDYVERGYREPITVQDAAAAMHMSKSNFMRFFRHVTGQPFITYLNHFRIAKAEVLLAGTSKTIAEIGQEVGFCDQSYFGLMFRTLLQMTPREYRRNLEKARAGTPVR